MKELKLNVAYKFIQIVKAKKFSYVSIVIKFDRITSFTKFYIYFIVPEPRRMDFPWIF